MKVRIRRQSRPGWELGILIYWDQPETKWITINLIWCHIDLNFDVT